MKKETTRTIGPMKIALIALLGAVVIYGASQFFANQRFNELASETQLLISEQQAVLATIAEITARNGADSVTESIVRDCSVEERSSFDSLLGNLNNNLTRTQLVELERLFGRCGGFFSERKAMMATRLVREIEVYESYVEQLSLVTGSDESESYNVEQWRELAVAEKKMSELFSDLVTKQDQIIRALLSGSSSQSEDIQLILREVNEIQETLTVTNTQVSRLRADLVSY